MENSREIILSRKEVSFWLAEGFALYQSKPIVEKYSKKNYKIWIYTEKNVEKLVMKYFADYNIEIILINDLRSIFLKILTKIFTILFIDRNFSAMYIKDLIKYDGLFINFINTIFPFKINIKNINKYYFNFMKIFNRFRFKGDFVIAFTRVYEPYLFANDKTKTILIMESWDHIVKRPHLIKPRYFFTWNKDLADDARKYQNHQHIAHMYPLKFRYIPKFETMAYDDIYKYITKENYLSDLRKTKKKNIILYPPSYSSIDDKQIHLDEIKFIKALVASLDDDNYIFFIKPKPSGPRGEYDCFCGEKSVIVGEYTPSADKKDFLDNEYHAYRYLLLRNSKLVINAGTTFGLDAAMAGIPVLHLNITEKNFGSYARTKKYHHVKKYLIGNDLVSNFTGMQKTIFCNDTFSKSFKYSQMLKQWCLNNASQYKGHQ